MMHFIAPFMCVSVWLATHCYFLLSSFSFKQRQPYPLESPVEKAFSLGYYYFQVNDFNITGWLLGY